MKIQPFSFKKMILKTSSAKCRIFFLGLNVLNLTEKIVPSLYTYRRKYANDE